jgi:hypothetical protein
LKQNEQNYPKFCNTGAKRAALQVTVLNKLKTAKLRLFTENGFLAKIKKFLTLLLLSHIKAEQRIRLHCKKGLRFSLPQPGEFGL